MFVQTDHEQEKDKSEKTPSGSRRVIYSSDSDEESDDEKEASAGKQSGYTGVPGKQSRPGELEV